MFDETHIGWLAGDDYEVAAAMREAAGDPDRPDETTPRRDLLGEILAGRWSDDDPPTAPRNPR
jgi:hypothetical protein